MPSSLLPPRPLVVLAGLLGAVGASRVVVGRVLDAGDELRRRCVPATA